MSEVCQLALASDHTQVVDHVPFDISPILQEKKNKKHDKTKKKKHKTDGERSPKQDGQRQKKDGKKG